MSQKPLRSEKGSARGRGKNDGNSSTRKSTSSLSQAVVPRSSSRQLQARHQGVTARRGNAGNDVLLAPKGYTMRPVVPAEKAELLSVARAMHREEFGSRVQKLFSPETEAAKAAITSGVYVGWRCPEFKWDCIRLGRDSRCFCGHDLCQHAPYNGHSLQVPCQMCPCKAFAFVPARPEDIGEFWFQRRRDFDPSAWRAKCRCKHTHEDHHPNGSHRCRLCGCSIFTSNFLCAACDRHWEDHQTVFETEDFRHQNGLPYGTDYLPFAEMPDLRNLALTGRDEDPGASYRAITDGSGPIPRSRHPTDQNSPFRPIHD